MNIEKLEKNYISVGMQTGEIDTELISADCKENAQIIASYFADMMMLGEPVKVFPYETEEEKNEFWEWHEKMFNRLKLQKKGSNPQFSFKKDYTQIL